MASSPLSNRDVFPSDEVIGELLGKTMKLWTSFFAMLRSDFPDLQNEWRYYNDGKSWLMKITRKQKTIAWLSVIEGTFRTTFYLPPKVADRVEELGIPEPLKDQYRKNPRMTKGITITYSTKKDVTYARELIALKSSMR
ncbi:MAG TPA: DUF3788 family protein [Spirochaetia bacterium]